MNPLNNLFIKLMLTFWLTSSLILVLVISLPHIQKQYDREMLGQRYLVQLQHIAKRLESADFVDIRQINARLKEYQQENEYPHRTQFFIIDNEGRSVGQGPRRLPREVRHFLIELDNDPEPMRIKYPKEMVFGPTKVVLNGLQFDLIGHTMSPHPFYWMHYLINKPFALLILTIGLSGLVFGATAWRVGQPLRQMKQAAQALAKGDLDARVDSKLINRGDEIGQLASSFNHMADAVASMVKGQQTLISNISHELRTPLTRVQLALALGRKKADNSAEIERIGREANLMDEMIREILSLSRLNMQITDEKQPFDLVTQLESVLEDAKFEAEQLDKILYIELPKKLTLVGVPVLLLRAIENLLRNALKYADYTVTFELKRFNDRIIIRISDDGPGVAESELESIFKPFYRISESRERESGGWGLGLAIALGAIEAHHGTLKANNRAPHGLTMSIELPVTRAG